MRAALLALASVLLAPAAASPSRAAAECREMGFSDVLVCSRCEKLKDFLPKDDPLLGECQSCCTDDVSESATYSKIVLEVCQ